MFTLMSKHLCNLHTCICMCVQDTSLSAHHTRRQKCACIYRCAPMQLCSNFFAKETIANYFESCASIVQAVVCRILTCCLDAIGCPQTVRKESKSSLAHDAVAADLSHNHPLIIHVGVGPISWSMVRTHAWLWSSCITKFYFRHFFVGFRKDICVISSAALPSTSHSSPSLLSFLQPRAPRCRA